MASFADLTLQDSSATNRTFSARVNDGRSQTWRYSPDTVVINDRTLTTKFMPSSKDDGEHKVEVTVNVPLVDAPAPGAGYTPAPKRVAMTQLKLIAFLPARAAIVDRQNAVAFLRNALANAQLTDLLVNYSPPRG